MSQNLKSHFYFSNRCYLNETIIKILTFTIYILAMMQKRLNRRMENLSKIRNLQYFVYTGTCMLNEHVFNCLLMQLKL